MQDTIFLSVDDVLLLHADTIDSEGGSHGVRDHGLLDAAVAMPRQQFGGAYLHKDLVAMAAAYVWHIAQNHPFIDGNKRAAVLSALVFLKVNEVENLPGPRELESITLQVAAGESSKDSLTKRFRNNVGRKK